MIVGEVAKVLLGEVKNVAETLKRSEAKQDLAAIRQAQRMIRKCERQFKKEKIGEEEKDFLIDMIKASLKANIEDDENE